MIIGIDLGTTNSLVSIWRDGQAEIIPNSLNQHLTPSVVGIDEKGIILVGQAAKERFSTHPEHTASNFKRFMGTNRELSLGNKRFRAEELSSFIIRALKQDAENYLGTPITEAIITVPAYFSDAQRKATKGAGELAGLKVERLLNEPTAAAMAYGIHTKNTESKYLVFDLGGGTFDISILEIFDGVMEVHASAGDNHLGGTDFTHALTQHFIQENADKLNFDLNSLPPELEQRITIQAEKVKRQITESGCGKFVVNWQDEIIELSINETAFENLTATLTERLSRPIRGALRDAKVLVEDINEIVLVGGATRMPLIRKLATRLFQRFPATGLNPDEVIVQGAAIQAGLKMRDSALNDLVLTDVCPYSLGVEVAGGNKTSGSPGHFHPIIERNNYIPISRIERLYTFRDNQKAVDVKIYQGESPLVKDNVYLGKLSVNVPPKPEGEESIDVRFTYDINGLLEVIVTVVSTQEQHSIVIEENPGVLTPNEIDERFLALESLKVHPRDQQDNMVIINRSERLYRDLLGDERAFLGQWIARFHQELSKQNSRDIAAIRKEFEAVLDQLEGAYRF